MRSKAARGHRIARGRVAAALLLVGVPTTPLAAQLVVAGNQQLYQDDFGESSEVGDHFGAALAAGDFNRDGYADLAIGIPDENLGAVVDAGAVIVVYGSAAGLDEGPVGAQVIHQDVSLVGDVAEAGDRFGAAVVAGDFNGDGWDDLVVGIPGETLGSGGGAVAQAGAIQLFLSSVGGVVPAADDFIDPDDFNAGTYYPRTDGVFGTALAACDLDGDGRDDLVVGAPGDTSASYAVGGYVLRLPGEPGGLSTGGAVSRFLGLAPDRYGAAVACLDRVGGHSWIAAGAPESTDFSWGEWGTIDVLRDGTHYATHFALGDDCRFGVAVALGRFAGGGLRGLIGGAPNWALTGFPPGEEGKVFYRGLDVVATTDFDQNSAGVADSAELADHFGTALAVGDFDRDGHDDAVVGVPDEDLDDGLPGEAENAGVVHILPGGDDGPTATGSDYWRFDSVGFSFLPHDRFGAALAVGDFDGNGVDDLAIGASHALQSGNAGAGIVQILYGWPPGWIFGDTFESGNTQKWSQ